MQLEAMQACMDAHYPMIVAPTGCGKSKAVWAISILQMQRHGVRKVIILVPQTIIGKSYDDGVMRTSIHGDLEWVIAPKDRLTSPTTSKMAKKEHFVTFLKSCGRALICSYQTFVAAYNCLSKKDREELFAGVFVWVDECHHLAFSKNGQKAEFNRMGHIIDELVSNVPSCRIGMVTATYLRGDLQSILRPETCKKFSIYEYSYERYFNSMKYLETFEYKFIPYQRKKGKVAPALVVGSLFDEWNAKTIIYVPHALSNCSHGKTSEVQAILESIGLDENGLKDYPEDENGLIHIIRKDGTKLKVINLVDEEDRDRKKLYIEDIRNDRDEKIREANRQKLDVVIALGMFKEGADWEFAERSIIIGYRGSLGELVQITGRLFRDIPGKKHVEVNHLIEATLATQTSDFEGDLKKIMSSLIGVMLMENIYSPVKMASEKRVKDDGTEDYVDYLAGAIPQDKRQDFLAEVFTEVINRLKSERDDEIVETFREEEFDDIVERNLDREGFDKTHLKEIADKIWRIIARTRLKTRGLDVNNVDIKLIRRANPVTGLSDYFTEKMTGGSFTRFKELFYASRMTPDAWIKIAEMVASADGGNLRHGADIKRMDHETLMRITGEVMHD
jgi:superfamily II DNA or RNA helicase